MQHKKNTEICDQSDDIEQQIAFNCNNNERNIWGKRECGRQRAVNKLASHKPQIRGI